MTDLPTQTILDPDWYAEVALEGVDCSAPGIYEWRIEGVGVYIGQYTRDSRPRRNTGGMCSGAH